MKSFLDEVSREEKNAWKTELLDEYQESLNYLENLINAGEKPDHAAEFIAAFKKHKQWFSSIMEQIEKSSDSRYFQLFQKNTALKNVVTAIKFIEQELQKRFSYTTDNEDFKRLRVLALYDINSLVLQKQQREKEGALESTQLSDNECLLIVALIVEQLSSGKKISDLEKSLKEHTKLLAASQEEATRQKIRAIEADKKCKELSTTLEKKVAEQDAAALVMKTTLVPKLEAATKENLSLKAIIMDKEKTIQRLQRPPAPAPVPTPAPVNPFAATAPTPPPSVLPTVALAKEEASAKRDATLSPLDTTKTIQQPVKPTAATTTITAPTAQEAERIRREAIKQDLEKRKKILLRQ
ncbi:hypothetical protein FJZ55_09015 [Candidatus Woesearchaeota archaeon]|nr:hypothetical protein [Candidatus Woesearchaeota archaeon]